MIHILPGMGADSGMFGDEWRGLPGATFVDWPPYGGETTLAEIAARIVAEHAIADGAMVVGTSLGGMIACEIANQRKLSRLVLVGSAIHPREIAALLTALRPLAPLAPAEWLRLSASVIPGEVARMFSQAEPAFIRAAIAAVFKWEGLNPRLPRPIRIHGKNDWIIPPPPRVDLLLDGGHLIAMTHAKSCCDYLASLDAQSSSASTVIP